MSNERVTVGMKPARRECDDDIAVLNPVRAQQLIRFDDSHSRSREVVVVVAHHPRMFGGFTANQRRPRRGTGFSYSPHNVGDAFGDDLAARNVIGHKQWFCANDHDVVNNHPDEILTDCVVNIECLSDRNLGADTVGRCGENRVAKILEERSVEEPGKPAHASKNVGAVRR